MKVSVFGTGYVGLVTGTCLAEMGNQVLCVDIDKDKIEALNNGKIPIFEPGLTPMVVHNHHEGRLQFTTDAKQAVLNSDLIMSSPDYFPRNAVQWPAFLSRLHIESASQPAANLY